MQSHLQKYHEQSVRPARAAGRNPDAIEAFIAIGPPIIDDADQGEIIDGRADGRIQ